MFLFARNFVKHPNMVGWMLPSSPFLVNEVLKQIDWDKARVIVEYGPGVGTGPRVTVEEQVTRDFSLTYSTNTAGAQQRIIHLEYDLSDKVSLIGERDQNGVLGVEVRFRRRFK